MKKNVLVVIILMIIFSCKKDIEFSGITETNDYGDTIGTIDLSDWRLDDKWTKQEEDLFSVTNSIGKKSATLNFSLSDSPVSSQINIIAYPNPFVDRTMLSVGSYSHYSIRVIDSNFKVVLSHDDLTTVSYEVNATPTMGKNQIYRIYYKLYSNEVIYRGHGDIQRN